MVPRWEEDCIGKQRYDGTGVECYVNRRVRHDVEPFYLKNAGCYAAASNAIGRRLKPKRKRPSNSSGDSSCTTRRLGNCLMIIGNATAVSMRERGAPMQKWMPCPNATCRFGARVMSKRSGSANCSVSRLAEASQVKMI